jgi:hypothetical protein
VSEFAQTLRRSDRVALEATMNTAAIAGLLGERAGEVVVSNPFKTGVIAEAKIKTDKVDARVLAELLAADYLPSVWQADETTKALGRQVGQHIALVRQRTRVKNRVQAILARNLLPRCPSSDLFGIKGRRWLADQDLPADERRTVRSLLRQLDFAGEELKLVDGELARATLDHANARRLMTIHGGRHCRRRGQSWPPSETSPGSSPATTSSSPMSGSTRPCDSPVAGRDPRAYLQAGSGVGSGHAAGGRPRRQPHPGPLHAFFERVRARRGGQIATVAVARKLLVICWHMIHDRRDYAFSRPSLVAKKTRALELQAGAPAHRGRPAGTAAAYNLRTVGDRERALGEQAEDGYNHLTRNWQATRPPGITPPASPARARQPSLATPDRPGGQGCPWGRLRRP